jgi:hypothetical protein
LKGSVCKITYRRNWYLQDEEIGSLLEANGGAARWLEISAAKDKTRVWARDDGAAAACPRYRPLSIVFETDSAESPSSATAAASAAQSPATNQSADGASASRAGQDALPPASPVQPEASKPAGDPASAAKTAPLANASPPLPPTAGKAAQPDASEKHAERQPVFVAAPGLGYLVGVLAVFALTGSGIYLFKRRFRSIGALPVVARRS